MIVATASVHWRNGFFMATNGIEFTLGIAGAAVGLGLAGPGGFSLDALLGLGSLWARRAPAFAGPGHTAVFVVDPNEFASQDPFILLADDRLDMLPGAPLGGEHPHAGFEIATFALEGALHDAAEGVLRAGDVLWTTAGRGIIHGEHVVPEGRTRILQLWITLPEAERWSEPRFETISRDAAPVRLEQGVEARVYRGSPR